MYDKLIDIIYKYKLNPKSVDEYELKNFELALVTFNILEAFKIHVSFACSFAFNGIKTYGK